MPIDHPSPAKKGLDLPWNSRTAAGCVCKNVVIQMIKTTHDLAASIPFGLHTAGCI